MKTCLHCERPLVGRKDKRFCDDQCRATYNNDKRYTSETHIRQVNSVIRRNRKILKSLCPVGKATVRRVELEEMGYNFNYFSHIFPSKGKVYYFCYDYGFTPIVERETIQKVLIIQQQDYMKRAFDPWKYLK
jgi:hypothetical protein